MSSFLNGEQLLSRNPKGSGMGKCAGRGVGTRGKGSRSSLWKRHWDSQQGAIERHPGIHSVAPGPLEGEAEE